MKKTQGFTLIELMIVVAIIGILTSIAYPSYQETVAKSRRADATGALLSLANKMEQYFTVNNTYVGATAVTGDSTDYYALTIPALTLTATGYVLSAAPATSDHCGALTYTSTGIKAVTGASTGYTADNCW